MIQHQYVGETGQAVYVCSYIASFDAPTLFIVPNVGWYHVGPNRIFTQIANRCLAEGINTIVFDYLGEGESSGNCRELTMDRLQYSFHVVYKYIQATFKNKLFGLGIGVGNHLILDAWESIRMDGVVLYQPEFEILKHFEDVFSPSEIEKAAQMGLFYITKDKSLKSVFWRSFVGHYHDCTYNPISYQLVMELVEQRKDKSSLSCFDINTLVISAQDVEVDTPHVEVYVVPEFVGHIVPEDWNVEVNKWPLVVERVNHHIVAWLTKQLDAKPCYEILTRERTKRTIVPFTSGEETLHGVLHTPLWEEGEKPCVIFLPGLGGDKVDNFLCGPRLGDYLAENGLYFFRYNNRYSGSSVIDLSGFTWSKVNDDFHQAYETLGKLDDKINLQNIILIAWSEGAKLATYIANHYEGLKGVCFWNPVLDDTRVGNREGGSGGGKRRLPRFAKNLSGQVVTQLGGEFLGIEYFGDHKQYDFFELFSRMSMPMKILWGSMDVQKDAYKSVMQRLEGRAVETEIVESDDHLFSYDLLNEVHQKTYLWIESILSSDPVGAQ